METNAVFGWEPPLLPLKVTISSGGKLAVSLSASWVTALGRFSVSAEGSHEFVRQYARGHLLVVRTVEDGGFHETGYAIECDRAYRVFLNGRFETVVDSEKTVISIQPNTESTLVVVDAKSNLDPDMRPLPEYQIMSDDKEIYFSNPISNPNNPGVDLDKTPSPTVGEFGYGGILDSRDIDVWHEFGTGIQSGFYNLLGTTNRASPTPEECRDDARSNSAGVVDPDDFAVGRKFCVITSKDNVAFMTMIAVIRENGAATNSGSEVKFRVTRWQKIRYDE